MYLGLFNSADVLLTCIAAKLSWYIFHLWQDGLFSILSALFPSITILTSLYLRTSSLLDEKDNAKPDLKIEYFREYFSKGVINELKRIYVRKKWLNYVRHYSIQTKLRNIVYKKVVWRMNYNNNQVYFH